jgi:transposase
LTSGKATPERAWLSDVSAVVLQQALADLTTAYRSFFASLTGGRKGPKVAPPTFRSRKDRRQAIRFTANARFRVLPGGKLRLPKIGDVPVRWSRSLPSEPSSVTVVKDAAGRYFASFVVQAAAEQVVSTTYVTPYPPGYPVLVPGQVFSQEILAFMRSLGTPEVHGYRPGLGYRVYLDKALELVACGPFGTRPSRPDST